MHQSLLHMMYEEEFKNFTKTVADYYKMWCNYTVVRQDLRLCSRLCGLFDWQVSVLCFEAPLIENILLHSY